MYKIILKTLLNAVPLILLLGAFTVYGYLLTHGYDIGSEKAKRHAHIYLAIGQYGLLILLISFPFVVYYTNKEENNVIKDSENSLLTSESLNMKKEEKISEEYIEPRFCKWAFNIWVAYTVVWVMKLPYTNDGIYMLLGLIVGICWWRSKKANEQKDLEISEDK